MKVLVTGATGFIGNYVIEELLKRGINVIATSTSTENAKSFSWFTKTTYIPYKISGEDQANLFDYFGKPDVLIHLSWEGLPNYTASFHYEKNLFDNYNFLKNLIENGVRNINVTGTCFEYGLTEGELSENQIASPDNSYALAKDTLRKFLLELQKRTPFSMKWIRLFYMYGKGQPENSLIPQLEKAIANKEDVFNMSGGEQERDYLKVEVVAKNIVDIALQNEILGIINCASGNPIKIKDFVKQYLETIEKNIELNLGYYPYSQLEPMAFWGNIDKLKLIKKKESPPKSESVHL